MSRRFACRCFSCRLKVLTTVLAAWNISVTPIRAMIRSLSIGTSPPRLEEDAEARTVVVREVSDRETLGIFMHTQQVAHHSHLDSCIKLLNLIEMVSDPASRFLSDILAILIINNMDIRPCILYETHSASACRFQASQACRAGPLSLLTLH